MPKIKIRKIYSGYMNYYIIGEPKPTVKTKRFEKLTKKEIKALETIFGNEKKYQFKGTMKKHVGEKEVVR